MDQAIIEGQKKLEGLRAGLKQERQPTLLRDHMHKTFQIEVTSGNPVDTVVEKCQWHPTLELEEGKCPECERQRIEKEGRLQRMNKARIEEALGNLGIGPRYKECSFDNYIPSCDAASKVLATCKRYAETFPERMAGGDNLFLLGGVGTGKNHLAAAICNYIIYSGFNPVHTTAIKIIRRIRSTWKNKDEDEQAVIDSFSMPDLLVVDEIGRQSGTEDESRLLFDALNGRYEQRKPTILISNMKVNEIAGYFGAALMDRLKDGNSCVAEFRWGSYRTNGATHCR